MNFSIKRISAIVLLCFLTICMLACISGLRKDYTENVSDAPVISKSDIVSGTEVILSMSDSIKTTDLETTTSTTSTTSTTTAATITSTKKKTTTTKKITPTKKKTTTIKKTTITTTTTTTVASTSMPITTVPSTTITTTVENPITACIDYMTETAITTTTSTTTAKPTTTTTKKITTSNKVYLGNFRLTAYCGCKICNGKWAGQPGKLGKPLRSNHTIAVDPNVIPLGSKVMINGNIYYAEDTGSAIKGDRIDIYFDSHQQANNFGVQYADVYLIK